VVCSHLLGEVERICDSLIAIDGGELLRAARVSAMTEARDVLVVEVAEGTDDLVTRLSGLGLEIVREGRALLVPLNTQETYDVIMGRWPNWICRCTHSTSAGTGWPSSSRGRPPMSDTTTGVIHDIGYQRYTGPRLGRAYAVRSLYTHGLRTAFGLGRSAAAKAFPWAVFGLVMVIATILTAVRAQTGENPTTYWEFPLNIVVLIVLFCAVVGPELVSRDLRGGVLPLYFSRPITRSDYALAKYAALASAVFILLVSPMLLMFIGGAFGMDGLSGVWTEFVEFTKGMAMAASYGIVFAALSLLVASLAGRRAVAAALVVAVFLISTPVYGVLMGLAYNNSNGESSPARPCACPSWPVWSARDVGRGSR
jgi:ABC-2 type transport system permease protein